MISDADRELATLYALDALPSADRMAMQRRIESDPELHHLVVELEADASLISLAAPPLQPPPDLRSRIVSAAASEVPLRIAGPAPAPPRRRPAFQILPWALAAGFAIFAGVLWSELQSAAKAASSLTQQRALSKELFQQVTNLKEALETKELLIADLKNTVSTLETRSSLAEMQVETLTSQLDASYLAAIAWDKDSQEGILHVRRLPETQTGKDYQLWVISPDSPAPISAGIFTVEPDGSATVRFAPTQPVSGATSFAVTVENDGGVPSPEGPVVLAN